jgi:hypothetical protein
VGRITLQTPRARASRCSTCAPARTRTPASPQGSAAVCSQDISRAGERPRGLGRPGAGARRAGGRRLDGQGGRPEADGHDVVQRPAGLDGPDGAGHDHHRLPVLHAHPLADRRARRLRRGDHHGAALRPQARGRGRRGGRVRARRRGRPASRAATRRSSPSRDRPRTRRRRGPNRAAVPEEPGTSPSRPYEPQPQYEPAAAMPVQAQAPEAETYVAPAYEAPVSTRPRRPSAPTTTRRKPRVRAAGAYESGVRLSAAYEQQQPYEAYPQQGYEQPVTSSSSTRSRATTQPYGA